MLAPDPAKNSTLSDVQACRDYSGRVRSSRFEEIIPNCERVMR
jgi:hypothetical protein